MVHEEVTEACLPRRESRQAATSDQHQHQGNRSMVVPIKAGDLLTWRDLAEKEVGFRRPQTSRYCIRIPIRSSDRKSRWDEVQMGRPV